MGLIRTSCFILLLLPAVLSGQDALKGCITGQVMDSGTNRPLSDAHILLKGTGQGATSGQNGFYRIGDLPDGNHTLEISFIGYKKTQKKFSIIKGDTLRVNILLDPEVLMEQEVTIIAKTDEHPTGKPLRINVIPIKKIETAPVENVPALLDYVSGVNTESTFGIFSSKAIVSMRGLPANDQSRTLILLDGIPLNKTDEGSVNWNMINKNNIEQIRVIKGPGPAMYGSGAMGGVIDIISKKPSKKMAANLVAEYGTYNTMGLNLDLSGIISDSSMKNRFFWNMNTLARKSDGYITEMDEFYTEEDSILVPTFLEEFNTSLKGGYQFGHNHYAELKFSYFDDKRGNGVQVFEEYGAFSEHDTYSGVGKYTGKYKKLNFNMDFFLLHENYQRMYEYMNEGEYQLYNVDSDRDDRGINLSVDFRPFDGHKVTGGYSYKLGSVDATDTYYTSTDIIRNAGNMAMNAAFVQDEINFFDSKLNLNVGFRYDFAKYYGGLFTIDYPSYSIEFISDFQDKNMEGKKWDALCPRISMQYRFDEKTRIYVSGARGFRAPILDDMTRTGKKKGTFKVANPDLGPELIDTYELGGDVSAFRNFHTGVSFYYSSGHDFMYYASTGDSVNMGYKIVPILQRKNISRAEIYGFEIDANYDIEHKWALFLNYSYTLGRIKEHNITDPEVDFDLSGKYLTDIPNHKVSGGISWMNKIVDATILYKYIGERWINDLNVVDTEYLLTDKYPDYSIFSLRLEKKVKHHLVVSVNIDNIFDTIYTDSNAQKNPGRFIMAGIRGIL
ncbi:MAG: TonB-dependent receptor [Bacteroidales bacterium]|nr:TonB-dependent receptor [Bacteroidales bacterium]